MFRLHSSHVPWLAGLAGAALTLTPLLAMADSLPPVEVQSQRLRTEVRQTCPAIAEQLADGLSAAVGRYGMEGDYRVSFTLQNNKIVQAAAQGGFEAGERRAIRAAMRGVDCQDSASGAAPQRFAFILSVRPDEGAEGPRQARIGIGIDGDLRLAQR